MSSSVSFPQGTFGREPQAKPEDDRYLRAAIQEYDNIAKLGQIMREGPIKVRHLCETPDTHKHVQSQEHLFFVGHVLSPSILPKTHWGTRSEDGG